MKTNILLSVLICENMPLDGNHESK